MKVSWKILIIPKYILANKTALEGNITVMSIAQCCIYFTYNRGQESNNLFHFRFLAFQNLESFLLNKIVTILLIKSKFLPPV